MEGREEEDEEGSVQMDRCAENESVQSRRFGTLYARCAVGTLEGGELGRERMVFLGAEGGFTLPRLERRQVFVAGAEGWLAGTK